LGPGKMLAVDTVAGRLLHDEEIKKEYATRKPYRQWVDQQIVRPPKNLAAAAVEFHGHAEPSDANGSTNGSTNGHAAPSLLQRLTAEEFVRVQKMFGYGAEDLDRVLQPMAFEAKEPVGSMGDDTPLSALSTKPQILYRYFKQRFAQVTNPPIDPLRERLVMSLTMLVGGRGCMLEEEEQFARQIEFSSPVLTEPELAWLKGQTDPMFKSATLSTCFPVAAGPEGLEAAVADLCAKAAAAVDAGCTILVLSDRDAGETLAPIPALLATSAVHHHLIRAGTRMKTSLVVESGEPREDHHFACLVGYGAALVCPYLALESVVALADAPHDGAAPIPREKAVANFKAAIDKGILKIMSKMGISTVSSYRGAKTFESLGVSRKAIEDYFPGTPCPIDGVTIHDVAVDALRFHAEAYGEDPKLKERGIYRYLSYGEYHAANPLMFKALHKAVRAEDRDEGMAAFRDYMKLVDDRPACNLRDLLSWKTAAQPIPLAEVEPVENIARRFTTQAMSFGALSRETHEVIAVAVNRIGGKSNSGEGGEDRERFYVYTTDRPDVGHSPWHPKKGDHGNSKIKQVASGRFGVTPEYLMSAEELEIKMAQGSKPGEGGQIPGMKVSEEIAKVRRSVPGVTLISPPPHHDIYSIEDLAQLIHDLKRVNPNARVGVKLVSMMGVGTIAAGVAKGYADYIQISGYDGGTGASPLSSIRNAGMPWELGLAETQQVLVLNDLRGRVRLRVDGGMRTGRDVILGARMGAEEFGFGTAALLATGCVMARRCHLNNCPVGIASQREDLRKKFPGTPEHVVA
ncbi:MAG: glutamate synthase-related protein, partial [Planctomycetia bacterium]